MNRKENRQVNIRQIRIKDDFWSGLQNLVADDVIPYQEKVLNDEIPGIEKSHAIANFRIAAGLEKGEFYGMVFQDSDVAKWLEGVAYSLAVKPDLHNIMVPGPFQVKVSFTHMILCLNFLSINQYR